MKHLLTKELPPITKNIHTTLQTLNNTLWGLYLGYDNIHTPIANLENKSTSLEIVSQTPAKRGRERQRQREKAIVFNQKLNRNMKHVVGNIISYNKYIHTPLLTLNNTL